MTLVELLRRTGELHLVWNDSGVSPRIGLSAEGCYLLCGSPYGDGVVFADDATDAVSFDEIAAELERLQQRVEVLEGNEREAVAEYLWLNARQKMKLPLVPLPSERSDFRKKADELIEARAALGEGR